jgi:hypothetical protein
VGDQVFHVQTEDRGPAHPILDAMVYHNGMVLYRRSSNYAALAASPDFTPEKLRQNVEAHHRAVVDDLRSGALAGEIAAAVHAQIQAREKASVAKGIQVQLLNPTAWLKAGSVSLDISTLRRADKRPISGVHVEATIEGALDTARHAGTTDEQGRARIGFPLPPLGKGDLALVIHAKTETAKDEIRFSMRSRAKSAPTDPVK